MNQYDNYFKKIEKKVPTLQIYMECQRKDIEYQYSSTENLNQRFHSASVGKLFCSTLILMAVEEGHVRLNSKINQILDASLLENLFVYKGKDYQDQVEIIHLLNHTSGVNDYYEGKTINHPSFFKQLMKNKGHIYTPYELLDFTRSYQKAVGYPTKKFLYSDTGYLLLGLILEEVYQKSYSKILREKIIEPLELKDTALAFYDEHFDQESLAPIIFQGVDMHLEKALSCDYSGGGLQTSAKDLGIFLKGLFTHQLIQPASLKKMMDVKHSFHGIMRYGLGMIEIKFHRLVPWMRHYPSLYGGLGSLSVHAFYDPKHHDVYVINLGTPKKMRLSFQILVKMAKWFNKK